MNNCFMQKHVNIRQNAEQQEKAIAKQKTKKKKPPQTVQCNLYEHEGQTQQNILS